MRCNAEFYNVGKSAATTRGFTMVLFTASRRNNFVGGTCALPSALLVHYRTLLLLLSVVIA